MFSLIRRFFWQIGVVLLAVGLFGAPGLARSKAGAGDVPGVMIGWHAKGDSLTALAAHEQALGKKFAVVRMYQQWQLPGKGVDRMVADGRLVVVSHKPPALVGWLTVALGLEDGLLKQLAQKYKSYGRQIVFIFHHEPHDDALDLKGGPYGLSANYVAAFRHVHDVFAAEGAAASAGGNVFFGYSATTPWVLEGDPPGSKDVLYPGDDVVDVLAHDRYNWASCRGDEWEEFADNWAPLVKLAAAHRKPLIIGEFGSPPAAGRRNEWFRNAAAWIKSDPDARAWLWGFSYYHSFHDNCEWDFLNQGDDGRLGWTEAFSNDPYFLGTPSELPRPAATPGLLPLPVLPALPLPVLPERPPPPDLPSTPKAPKVTVPELPSAPTGGERPSASLVAARWTTAATPPARAPGRPAGGR